MKTGDAFRFLSIEPEKKKENEKENKEFVQYFQRFSKIMSIFGKPWKIHGIKAVIRYEQTPFLCLPKKNTLHKTEKIHFFA